ncbi:MAG: hypothetical protein [Circular genetic element sp.]|nr:MAG: hypothetical protein [Circular genetic element sp.]
MIPKYGRSVDGEESLENALVTAAPPTSRVTILAAAITLFSAIEPTSVRAIVERDIRDSVSVAGVRSGGEQSRSTEYTIRTSLSSAFNWTSTRLVVKVFAPDSIMLELIVSRPLVSLIPLGITYHDSRRVIVVM